MRKKASLVVMGLVAGTAMSLTPLSPASAQPIERCAAEDPVLDYACQTIANVGPWAQYYYDKAGEVVYKVYCTAWPPC